MSAYSFVEQYQAMQAEKERGNTGNGFGSGKRYDTGSSFGSGSRYDTGIRYGSSPLKSDTRRQQHRKNKMMFKYKEKKYGNEI